ncbi:hypothetical protein S225a_10700 [Candidatus Brocadiaceae bacterium S225]|nr:hypothetical protein S225a_10700 [Candidatus Brocadiaceae bacterium S225]
MRVSHKVTKGTEERRKVKLTTEIHGFYTEVKGKGKKARFTQRREERREKEIFCNRMHILQWGRS